MRPTTKPRSGVALIELALLVTILITIMMGTIDFARVFYAALTVTDGARAGAQYGSQSNTHSGEYTKMEQAATDNAKNVSGFSAKAERFCTCRSGTVVNCLTGACPAGEGAPQIYVRVTGTNDFNTVAAFPGIPSKVNLARGAVFRLQ